MNEWLLHPEQGSTYWTDSEGSERIRVLLKFGIAGL